MFFHKQYGLSKLLSDQNLLDYTNLIVLKVGDDPKNLLKMTREELQAIRDKLLTPLGIKFDAPNKVSLYLLASNCFIIENFDDEPVNVTLVLPKVSKIQKALTMPAEGNAVLTRNNNSVSITGLSPRALVVFSYN